MKTVITEKKIAKILIIVKIFRYVKSIDNDITHRKIFTIIDILAVFIFLNMANLLLITVMIV